jgi:hypothetical protein
MNPERVEVLGIDIGGVIIERVDNSADTSFFGANYLRTPAILNSFNAIGRLVGERFHENVYLISKCGVEVERKTLHWLENQGFYDKTGIHPDKILFCRKRSEKAGLCQRVGVTHFVDDRLEVLGYLDSVPYQYLFRPQSDEVVRFRQHLHRVQTVQIWQEILDALLPSK